MGGRPFPDGVMNAFTESGIKNSGSSKQNGQVVNQDSSSTAKIALFRSLFRGRTDVYPQEDTNAFLETCRQRDLPAALERSRSGNGGHIWLFFEDAATAC